MSQPCCLTKSVRFGRTELLFVFPCSKSRDLGPEHGFRACSLKNKGKKLDFHEKVGFWGVKKPKKNEKVERNRSNVGLRSSRWYQNDREGRRGYFRKIWAWKTSKKSKQIKIFSGIFHVFPVDFAKNLWIPVQTAGPQIKCVLAGFGRGGPSPPNHWRLPLDYRNQQFGHQFFCCYRWLKQWSTDYVPSVFKNSPNEKRRCSTV